VSKIGAGPPVFHFQRIEQMKWIRLQKSAESAQSAD